MDDNNMSQDMSDDGVEVEPDKDIKSKRRVQHYRDSWMEKFQWVVRDVESPFRAQCKVCNKGMNAQKCILNRHEKSSKHEQLMKEFQNNSKTDGSTTAEMTLSSAQIQLGTKKLSISCKSYNNNFSMDNVCNNRNIKGEVNVMDHSNMSQDMSDCELEVKPDKEVKARKRIQHYRSSWMENFPWVVRDVQSPLRAQCRVCKRGMNAHKSILNRHDKSSKHIKLTQELKNNNKLGDSTAAEMTSSGSENISISCESFTKDFSVGDSCNNRDIQVCFIVDPHISSVIDVLEKYVPEPEVTEVKRLIYGRPQESLVLSNEAVIEAKMENIELKSYKFSAAFEELSPPRLARVGIIQNEIVLATTDPVAEQRGALHFRMEKIVQTANLCGVKILCFQEAWTMPFAFCNKEKLPWCEFAEDIHIGPTTQLCQKWAKQYKMVIISPIIERDEAHGDMLWNTAVVISDTGKVIGESRKNHISRIGDFNESIFYSEGKTGYPVFQTRYGKIAVNIGDGRHIPNSWMMYGLNGAEIVFNPAAATRGLSEEMWGTDARSAAIANSFFTCSVNRVGKEEFASEVVTQQNYFGSSFIAAPDGSRTPELSRVKDGLLVAEIDLNLCRQIKDRCGLRNCQRLDVYADELRKAVSPNYEPNILKYTRT